MNRSQIARLLYNSDVDSGSSVSDIDDDIVDPDWNAEEDQNENIYENNDTVPDIDNNDDITGNYWTENFNVPHINEHIIFNRDNLPVGINPDIIDTMSTASPYTFFFLIF